MSIPSNLCLKCFKPNNGQSVCPNCGWSYKQNEEPYLKNGTILQNRYIVGVLLKTNGEGALYSGWDNIMNSPVSIREFFPNNLCVRNNVDNSIRVIGGCEKPFNDYMHDFLELSRMLIKLRDIPAIVPVYDNFETNNTAYSITELVSGPTFANVMTRHEPLTFKQARSLFMPIINAVAALHAAGVCHYSINPENLIVDTEGRLRLTNFSIAAVNSAGTYLEPQIFEGYSAVEQYKSGSPLGTYTDVYSLAATMYFAMSGTPVMPVLSRINNEALAIPSEISQQLTPYAISALVKALKVHPETRTRSVDRFKQELTASSAVSGVVREYEHEQEQAAISNAAAIKAQSMEEMSYDEDNYEKPAKNKNMLGMIIVSSILGALLLIAIIVIFVMWNSNRNDDAITSSEPVSFTSIEESMPPVSVPETSQIVGGYAIPTAILGADYKAVINSSQWSYMNIQVDSYAFSDSYAEGQIMSVEPEVETIIQEGEIVYVTVSLGSESRTLPNVVGKQGYNAAAELSQLGFTVKIEETSNTTKDFGTVVSVNLTEGKKYSYGTLVTLTISTYVPPVSTTPSSTPTPPVSNEPASEPTPPESSTPVVE